MVCILFEGIKLKRQLWHVAWSNGCYISEKAGTFSNTYCTVKFPTHIIVSILQWFYLAPSILELHPFFTINCFCKKNSQLFTVYHPIHFMWIFCSSQSHNCSSVLFFYKLACGVEQYKGSVCNALLTMIISIFTGSIVLYTCRLFIHGKSFCITLTKMMLTVISNESCQGICACSNG